MKNLFLVVDQEKVELTKLSIKAERFVVFHRVRHEHSESKLILRLKVCYSAVICCFLTGLVASERNGSLRECLHWLVDSPHVVSSNMASVCSCDCIVVLVN